MAMCAPTALTRAATLLNDEQSWVSHTVNVRSVPSTGGLAATAAGAAAGAGDRPRPAGTLYARRRPSERRKPSNVVATEEPCAGVGDANAASTAVAPSAVPCSWNGAVAPELPVTDCGTTRYSAESAALFAGNVTHPESDAGSTEVYAPTASVICVARPPHAARGSGPAGRSQLHGAGPSERRAAEKRAFQQVLLVQHVVDVHLGPNDDTAEGKRVPNASVQNEVWPDVVKLVEIKQAGALRGIGAVVRNQARSVDAGGGRVEALGRVYHSCHARDALIVV